MNELDDVRALIDPQGYIDSLQQARTILAGNLGRLLVDYDLTAATPHMADEVKAAALSQLIGVLRDAKWRIEEIDRRIEAARNGAMGHQPNRAERRRKN